MRGFWLFVHNLGYSLWLGAGIAMMVSGVTAKRFAPAERLAVYRVGGAVWRALIGPGAMATLLSGLILAMRWMKSGAAPGWMNAMMGIGLVGGLVAVTMAMPTATRLARLELDPRGELPESFAGLRKRLVWTATIAGGMGLLALWVSTVGRS
jgi:hypothetical protein